MRWWSGVVVFAGLLALAGCTKCSQKPTATSDGATVQEAPQTSPTASEAPPAGAGVPTGSEGGTVDTLLDESGGIEDLPAGDNLEIEDEEPGLDAKPEATQPTKPSPKGSKSSK